MRVFFNILFKLIENAGRRAGLEPLLSAAAEAGHLQLVRFFLYAGADKEAEGRIGYPPLLELCAMCTRQDSHVEIVQVLLDAGADKDAKNNDGFTALMFASANGHTATVKALLGAGADKDAKNNDGFTALMFASLWGDTATVQALLAAGADKDAKNDDGRTALMLASEHGRGACPDQRATVQALVASGALAARHTWIKIKKKYYNRGAFPDQEKKKDNNTSGHSPTKGAGGGDNNTLRYKVPFFNYYIVYLGGHNSPEDCEQKDAAVKDVSKVSGREKKVKEHLVRRKDENAVIIAARSPKAEEKKIEKRVFQLCRGFSLEMIRSLVDIIRLRDALKRTKDGCVQQGKRERKNKIDRQKACLRKVLKLLQDDTFLGKEEKRALKNIAWNPDFETLLREGGEKAEQEMCRIMEQPLFSVAGVFRAACADKKLPDSEQQQVLCHLFKAVGSLTWLPDEQAADTFWSYFNKHWLKLEQTADSQPADPKKHLEEFVNDVKANFPNAGLIDGGDAWGGLLAQINSNFQEKQVRPLIVKAFARLASVLSQPNSEKELGRLDQSQAPEYLKAYQGNLLSELPETAAAFVMAFNGYDLSYSGVSVSADSSRPTAAAGGAAAPEKDKADAPETSPAAFASLLAELGGDLGRMPVDRSADSRKMQRSIWERLRTAALAAPTDISIEDLKIDYYSRLLSPIEQAVRRWRAVIKKPDNASNSGGDYDSDSGSESWFPTPGGRDWGDSSSSSESDSDDDNQDDVLLNRRGVWRGLPYSKAYAASEREKITETAFTSAIKARVPRSVTRQIEFAKRGSSFSAYVKAVGLLLGRFRYFYPGMRDDLEKRTYETLLKHPIWFFISPDMLSEVFLPLFQGKKKLDVVAARSSSLSKQGKVPCFLEPKEGMHDYTWQFTDPDYAKAFLYGIFQCLKDNLESSEHLELSEGQKLCAQTRLYLGLKALAECDQPLMYRSKLLHELLRLCNEHVGHAGKTTAIDDEALGGGGSGGAAYGGTKGQEGLAVLGVNKATLLQNVQSILDVLNSNASSYEGSRGDKVGRSVAGNDPIHEQFEAYAVCRDIDRCPHEHWAAQQRRVCILLGQEHKAVRDAIEAAADTAQNEFSVNCRFISVFINNLTKDLSDVLKEILEKPSPLKKGSVSLEQKAGGLDEWSLSYQDGYSTFQTTVALPPSALNENWQAFCDLIELYHNGDEAYRKTIESVLSYNSGLSDSELKPRRA
jgi:hypothetical protein